MFVKRAACLALAVFVAACGSSTDSNSSRIVVKSTAFHQGGEIPARYTCYGQNVSPPLEWSGGPSNATCYALVCEDADSSRGTFVHWLAWNIRSTSLLEALAPDAKAQNGTCQGKNSDGRTGWTGPCPQTGSHRYYFRVMALDRVLDLPETADATAFETAVKGHVLASGELMAKYIRD